MKRFYLSITAFVIVFCTSVCAFGANAVGAIPGLFNVSPTGAATYEIPIECPAGPNGLKPELKFVYSSQMGDGLMGCGWSIGGISAIARGPKNLHQDGVVSAVEYTSSDALYLDGVRLKKVEGSDTEFRTERDTYVRIVGFEPQASGFRYFKAYTKSGLTLTFGRADGDCSVYDWPLTEIEDANGNYISFIGLSPYVSDITPGTSYVVYGKNKSGAGYESVIAFDFKQSPIVTTQFVGGRQFRNSVRLSKVRVLGDGVTVLREYTLTYKESGVYKDRNRLAGISCSGGGEELCATSFTWSPNSYAIKSVKDPSESSLPFWKDVIDMAVGNCTGEGASNIAFVRKDKPLSVYKDSNRKDEYTLNGKRFDNIMYYDIDHDGVNELIATHSDIIGEESGGSWNYLRTVTHKVGRRDAVTGTYKWRSLEEYTGKNDTTLMDGYYGSEMAYRIAELPGDYYGDGRLRFLPLYNELAQPATSAPWYLSVIMSVMSTGITNDDGSRDAKLSLASKAKGDFPSCKNVTLQGSGKFDVTDVNGNGKSEFMYVPMNNGDIHFYEEQNGSFVRIMQNNINVGKNNSYKVTTGDFNGDGITDLLILKSEKKDNVSACVYLSTGKAFTCTNMGESLNLKKGSSISVIDVNSDGRSDVMVTDEKSVRLYVSMNDSFTEVATAENETLNPKSSKEKQVSRYYPVMAEINDGTEGRRYMECLDGVVELSPSRLFDKIVGIEDGLGNKTSVKYESVDCNGVIPQMYKWRVSEVKSSNSSGESGRMVYEYSGMLYGKEKNAFLGFSKVSQRNAESGREFTSYYSAVNSFPQLDRTEASVNGKLVQRTSYLYDAKTGNLTQQVDYDVLTGVSQTTGYKSYDAYGNPLTVETKSGKRTITQVMEYVSAGAWCASKPVSIMATHSYGSKSESHEARMTYDERGNLTSENKDGLMVTYKYDVFGNCTEKSAGDGTSMRTEKFEYEADGRHIISKTNVLGENTTYKWRKNSGLLMSETDAYGRTTKYEYDSFDALTSVQSQGGVRHTIERRWADKGNPYNAAYIIDEFTAGSGAVSTLYTSDGREVCRKQKSFGGKDVYVVQEYNKDGTLRRVSMPSYEPTPSEWAEQYGYDQYGRTIKVTRPEGESSISYSGLTTTMTSPDGTVAKTMTAEGWLESVITNGKAVEYTYYPSGLLQSATPEDGLPIKITYDIHGNRTSIKDADGGTENMKYNCFGEVTEKSRKAGRGSWITTTYTYSDRGLLQQMNCGGDITSYTYDSRNRLLQKTTQGGVSQSYKYDNFDRITSVTDVIGVKRFERSTEYDEYGRAIRETYPSGYYIENVYDENGFLTMVKDNNGGEIYKPLEADALGRTLKESRGGAVTEYSYDITGNMLTKVSGERINHAYTYDKRGNLASFTDRLSSQGCKYVYDEFNRLAQWETYVKDMAAPARRDSIMYDDANNIIRKSALGDALMLYEDNNHPHAVSSISGVPSSFPKEEQNVTYTAFNKVESVTEGDKRYDIIYNPNEQRIKTTLADGKGVTTRYYIGNYEEVTDPQGVTTKYHYLPGGAVMIEKGGERNLYYNYTDRLGSVVATTDADGNVVEKYAYDPWGARLNPENWTEQDTRTDLLNNRGFTGHEHIDGMSLIDMNGRVYDPLIGSFLSVDPFIQAPDNWLNYNRYMYCFGNPLKYTDPSGHIGVFAAIGIGAAIGAVLGTGAGLWYGYNKGYSGWNLAKSALIGAGIGAGVGAVSGYFIGSSISSVMASKTLWNFTQAGASIGETVGLVGGSVYGLAKKADGWELANYAGLGAGIGLVAGAAIGAGCYGIYSYGGVVANSANDVTRLSNAKTVAINEADEAYDYFYNSMKKDAKAIRPISPEKFLAAKEVQRQTLVNVDVASMNLANARSVASNVRIWANVGYAALTGVGTVGAGFGYHYLSNFLFDYIPSHLYGN